MTISPQLKKFVVVFGGAGLLFWLFRGSTDRKPMSGSKEPTSAEQMKNAGIALTAYRSARQAGESPAELEKVNQDIEKEYGLRVYYKQDGKFYVNDTKGNTVLVK